MMCPGRSRSAVWALGLIPAIAFLAIMGCSSDATRPCHLEPYSAPTLIGDLYDYCYGAADRTGDTLSIFLYLDTVNLPSQNANIQKLVLSSQQTNPCSSADRLEFFFTGSLVDSVDPGLTNQLGWKVAIPTAEVGYCQTCFTDCGLAPIIYLKGEVEGASFVYDPLDTLGVFIRHVGDDPPFQSGGSYGKSSIAR